MRKEFEMSEEQYKNLIIACQSAPLIMLQCGNPPSPQESANHAWARIGTELGFDSMTVEPCPGKNQRFFTAVVSQKVETIL